MTPPAPRDVVSDGFLHGFCLGLTLAVLVWVACFSAMALLAW